MAGKTKSSSPKKELTPTQQKVRTAINWTVNVICIVLIIFALVLAIFTIIRATNPDNITRVGDKCYFTVLSDSMEPTFSEKDIIIAKAYNGDGSDLKVGQVITFKFTRYYDNQGYEEFNTHRIVKIVYKTDKPDEVDYFHTRGDAKGGDWQDALNDPSSWDGGRIYPDNIYATWGTVLGSLEQGNLTFDNGQVMKGAGALPAFMQHPVHGKTRFFCIVVLPLILMFAIYAFILVRTLIIAKIEKDKKVVGETAISLDTMTEEEKQQLMQQLLASQNATANAGDGDAPSNDVADGGLDNLPSDDADKAVSDEADGE